MKKLHALAVFLLAACLFILCFLLAGALAQIPPRQKDVFTASKTIRPMPSFEPLTGAIHLENADLETLDTLPGIGPATAQAVHDYLASGGVFYFPEDIQNVKGIGPKKYQDIRPFLAFSLPPLPSLRPLFP